MKALQRYRFFNALRPFSLVVAVISCALGIAIAWTEDVVNYPLAMLIMLGGIAAQAGINLINDLEDIDPGDIPQEYFALKESIDITILILRNAGIGRLCFVFAALVSLYLSWLQGWILLVLIVVSAIFASGYNSGPLNFKNRGLAIIQVFLLMGILMVQGAYYSMTGQFSIQALLHALPIGLLVSALLLSNELRDWEVDREQGIGTFTVRAGVVNARRLFWVLIVGSYGLSLVMYLSGQLHQPLWLLLPLPMLVPIHGYLGSSNRVKLTPLTGRFFFVFGIAYILAMVSPIGLERLV